MSFMQAVTDAIANPKQVRLSQERASAKTYSHLAPKMKAIRDTSPEYVPGVYGVATHRTSSSFSSRPPSQLSSNTPSRATSRERSAPTLPQSQPTPQPTRPTAQLQRSHSEVPTQPKLKLTSCLSAIDLTPEQIKRNYSCDDLSIPRWDFSKNMIPPLNTMEGFGRYRVATNAEPEFRYHHLKRQVKDIECLPSMTVNLNMEAITRLPNEDWQSVTGSGSRRGSTVSSLSTMTDSSSSPLDPGARVARGFSPSGSSSRSSQTGYNHRRKGSSLSMMNLAGDSTSPPVPAALKRTSTMHSERRGSGLLSTIEELHTNTTMVAERRKVERPCEFPDQGDPDSAVASDAEDDESWTDIAETNPTKVSAITQMFKEGKIQQQPQLALARVRTLSTDKKRVRSTTTLDRSKTIRATRPELNRRQSKSRYTHEKGNSESKKTEEITEIADKSPPGLEIKIANPIKAQIKHQPSKELAVEQALKNVLIFDGDQKTTQRSYPTRNRSTTAIYRADPMIGRNNGQTQLAYIAK